MRKKMKIKKNRLKSLIRECIINYLNESTQRKVDNFNMVANMINLTDNDQFFFVQLMKRWKDNKDKGMIKKTDGTYHAGAEYGNYSNGTAFKVRSAQELMSLKSQIVSWCDSNNGRAYITCNPRSDSEIQSFLPTYKSRFRDPNDPRITHAEEILAGQAKADGAMAGQRPRFFFDIDSDDRRVWEISKMILRRLNIPIESEYGTPSDGLHVVMDDRNMKDMNKAIYYLRLFDGPLFRGLTNHFQFNNDGTLADPSEENHIVNIIIKSANDGKKHYFPDKGRFQLVHANFDGKLILYSNVVTAGY